MHYYNLFLYTGCFVFLFSRLLAKKKPPMLLARTASGTEAVSVFFCRSPPGSFPVQLLRVGPLDNLKFSYTNSLPNVKWEI